MLPSTSVSALRMTPPLYLSVSLRCARRYRPTLHWPNHPAPLNFAPCDPYRLFTIKGVATGFGGAVFAVGVGMGVIGVSRRYDAWCRRLVYSDSSWVLTRTLRVQWPLSTIRGSEYRRHLGASRLWRRVEELKLALIWFLIKQNDA